MKDIFTVLLFLIGSPIFAEEYALAIGDKEQAGVYSPLMNFNSIKDCQEWKSEKGKSFITGVITKSGIPSNRLELWCLPKSTFPTIVKAVTSTYRIVFADGEVIERSNSMQSPFGLKECNQQGGVLLDLAADRGYLAKMEGGIPIPPGPYTVSWRCAYEGHVTVND